MDNYFVIQAPKIFFSFLFIDVISKNGKILDIHNSASPYSYPDDV